MTIETVNINGELFEVDENDPRHSSNQFRDSQEVLDENEAIFQRSKRDGLLAETDWMANSDVTMSDEWKAYRQALRDIPQQSGFPNNITYPTKPS